MALRHGPALAGTINAYHHATHCPASLEELLQRKTLLENREAFEFPLMYHTCAILKYTV
jgi:hypothetical protein